MEPPFTPSHFSGNHYMNAFRKRHENGVAVLEFALSSSVLIALLAGVFQFGYSFFVYNQLMVAVSNAGELGSKMNYDTANPSAYSTALQNMVVYGDTTEIGRASCRERV